MCVEHNWTKISTDGTRSLTDDSMMARGIWSLKYAIGVHAFPSMEYIQESEPVEQQISLMELER